MRVAIVLCTYNGAGYLREQLDSLLIQTFTDWHCYVFDDCSTDGTQNILHEYAGRFPDHFTVAVNPERSGSAAKNFISATEHVFRSKQFDLLSYCDQDDVWDEKKLAILTQQFRNVDSKQPLLVFSDLSIVDDHLNELHPSFVNRISVGGYSKHIQRHFIQIDNIVPGCALACNRALLESAVPFSKHTTMHDWWIVLVALKNGSIVFVPEKLVQYRQHAENSVGARSLSTQAKILRTLPAITKFSEIYKMVKELYPEESRISLIRRYAFVKLYKFVRF